MGLTFEQEYGDVLKEFVAYCNEQPRTSRCDHLDALAVSFIHLKMGRWR